MPSALWKIGDVHEDRDQSQLVVVWTEGRYAILFESGARFRAVESDVNGPEHGWSAVDADHEDAHYPDFKAAKRAIDEVTLMADRVASPELRLWSLSDGFSAWHGLAMKTFDIALGLDDKLNQAAALLEKLAERIDKAFTRYP